MARILNLGGAHIFRRRFKPHRWEQVHLALHPGFDGVKRKSPVLTWLLALTALFLEFRPRLRFSLRWLYDHAIEPIVRHPSATLVAALSGWLFYRFNPGGMLPAETREHFSFMAQAPLSEWLGRSVISDFLYLNAREFWLLGTATVLVIGWAESRTSRLTAALVVLGTSLFDDLVNYALITYPLLYFRPQVFQKLIQLRDVGGSLILMTVLGFGLRSLQKNREFFFVGILLLVVLSVGIRFDQLHLLILNLNHSLFLCIGFLLGQWKVQLIRARSRKVARLKPPEGRTVLSSS